MFILKGIRMNNIVSPLDLSQYFFYPVEIQALAAECKRQRERIADLESLGNLAAAQAAVQDYRDQIAALQIECEYWRDQIATLQADKAKLREVLGGIVNSINLVLVAGD